MGGEGSKYWTCVSQVLPATVSAFLDGSVFSPANEFRVKLGKVVLKLLSRVNIDSFLALTKIDKLCENLSKVDVLRANAHTRAGRICYTVVF